jgi:hypothetical protein
MKKITMLLSLLAMLSLLSAKSNAQNTGITDKPSGITPQNVLQVHKDGSSAGTVIQVTNDATGTAANSGFQIGFDGSQNAYLLNNGGKVIIGGGSSSNTTVENDGTIVLNDSATVWEDYRVTPLLRLNTDGTINNVGPTFTQIGSSGLYAYTFNDGTTDNVYFEIQMPHNWAEGTNIYPHVHWIPASNSSGTVEWSLQYQWVNLGGSFSGTATTPLTGTQAVDVNQYKSFMTGLGGGISGAGMEISSILLCHLYRVAGSGSVADTYPGSALLLSVDIHYKINTMGSRGLTTK